MFGKCPSSLSFPTSIQDSTLFTIFINFLCFQNFMSQTSRLPRKTAFEKIKIHQKASSSWLRKDLNLLLPLSFSSFLSRLSGKCGRARLWVNIFLPIRPFTSMFCWYPRKIPSFFVSDLLVSEYPAKNQVLDSAATENVAWNLSFARKRNGVLRNFIEID